MTMKQITKGYPNWDVPYNENVDEYNNTIGNVDMGTTATTITGAIKEIKELAETETSKIQTVVADVNNNKIKIAEHTTQLNEKANNWLQNKIINFWGDSITYNASKNTNWYPKIVGEILKCTANNYGVNGALMAGANGICYKVSEGDVNSTINVIMAGTNDFNRNIPIGTINDTEHTTFYGALNKMALTLISTYPNAINVLMTPLKRSKEPAEVGNYKLIDYAIAIQNIAKKYNFLLINMYDNAPNYNPNIESLYKWSFDGLHPTDSYFETFFARKIAQNLLSLTSDSPIIEDELNVKSINNTVTYYVSASGSDVNKGTETSPYKTINKALSNLPNVINCKVEIIILSGTYDEDINIRGFIGTGRIDITGSDTCDDTRVVNNVLIENNVIQVKVKGISSKDITVKNCNYIYLEKIYSINSNETKGGINIYNSRTTIIGCTLSNKKYGIYCTNANVYSNTNTGTNNIIGISSNDGSVIAKYSNQPDGTTSEKTGTGGVIR